jgi:hypothetical protein
LHARRSGFRWCRLVGPAWLQAKNTFFLTQNGSAPRFSLIDQAGHRDTSGEHFGRFTLLTFLDPVCYTDSPLLAAQLQGVSATLGANAPLDIVAVAAHPFHETLANVNKFIKQHRRTTMKNFYFVTTLHPMVSERVRGNCGVSVTMQPPDKMSIHSHFLFVIDLGERLKLFIPNNPLL